MNFILQILLSIFTIFSTNISEIVYCEIFNTSELKKLVFYQTNSEYQQALIYFENTANKSCKKEKVVVTYSEQIIGKEGNVAKGEDELLLMKFNTLTQNELKNLYTQLVKTEIKGTAKTITQAKILSELQVNTSLINPYRDIWTMYNTIDPILILDIRKDIPTIITSNGVKNAMLKMPNDKFMEFIRYKMPAITSPQMGAIVRWKNSGKFVETISELAIPEKLSKADFEKIFGTLDDLDIFNLTQNTTNFKTVTEAVKKTAGKANKFSNIAGKISNFANLLVLTETLRTGESVSPANILSALPHPIALLSYWAKDVIDRQEIAMNEAIWDVAPNWAFVVNWEEKWRGEPGIPDETLYMYYTDVQDKCNPEKIPTSIVIKDKQVAQLIFGFVPKYVDFDVQSRIFTKSDGKIFFKPTKQVAY